MWKKLMSKIDLEQPIRITDHVYVGCTQRESETNKKNRDGEIRTFQQDAIIQFKHD